MSGKIGKVALLPFAVRAVAARAVAVKEVATFLDPFGMGGAKSLERGHEGRYLFSFGMRDGMRRHGAARVVEDIRALVDDVHYILFEAAHIIGSAVPGML